MTLLDRRRKEFKIPPFPAAMTFDNVAIWRIKDNQEARTAGGLVVPQTYTTPDGMTHDVERDVENRGVLVGAGPGAMDELYSQGISVGEIVWFGRFAGDEKQIVKRGVGETEGQYMLLCKSRDVIAGEDLNVALASGALRVVRDSNGEHAIEDGPSGVVRKLVKRKDMGAA